MGVQIRKVKRPNEIISHHMFNIASRRARRSPGLGRAVRSAASGTSPCGGPGYLNY